MARGRYILLAVILGAVVLLALGAIKVFALGPFSQQDRQALARQTIQAYWSDVQHGKVTQAYALLTSGNQASRPLSNYTQDMYGFLEGTGGVQIAVGKAEVNRNFAVVPVTLHSPKSTQNLHAYQHLFWEDGKWRITDPNGGLSSTK